MADDEEDIEQDEESPMRDVDSVDNNVNTDSGPNDAETNEDDGNNGSSGGMFGNYFQKRKDEKLKTLKGKIKSKDKEDLYQKHHLSKRNVDFTSSRSAEVKKQLQKFNNQAIDRKKVGTQILQSKDLEQAENLEKHQYKSNEKKEQKEAVKLHVEVLKEDAKAATEMFTPVGCLKNVKGCLKSTMVIAFVFIGSIVGILKLCGLF